MASIMDQISAKFEQYKKLDGNPSNLQIKQNLMYELKVRNLV